MGPGHQDDRKKRKRKSRTEQVSSPSSSESDSTSKSHGIDKGQLQQKSTVVPSAENVNEDQDNNDSEDQTNSKPQFLDAEQAFDDFYLQQLTKEFANDLDKLRSANDFNTRSVPMLIEALRQGKACFTPEERNKIGEAAVRSSGSRA